jgi:hypothetical protein
MLVRVFVERGYGHSRLKDYHFAVSVQAGIGMRQTENVAKQSIEISLQSHCTGLSHLIGRSSSVHH